MGLDAILAVFLATHGSSYSLARVIVISVDVCGCSDGVSRAGTFLTIHCQLERLKTEGVVDFSPGHQVSSSTQTWPRQQHSEFG